MSENQPRDDKGRFVKFNSDNPIEWNDNKTLGVYDESDITPAVEWSNVQVSLLKQAIDKAEEPEGVVRIGTVNRTGETDSGRCFEDSLVFLKSGPSDDEVVTIAGLRREWNDD